MKFLDHGDGDGVNEISIFIFFPPPVFFVLLCLSCPFLFALLSKD
jgi:hypothetical protein